MKKSLSLGTNARFCCFFFLLFCSYSFSVSTEDKYFCLIVSAIEIDVNRAFCTIAIRSYPVSVCRVITAAATTDRYIERIKKKKMRAAEIVAYEISLYA